MQMKGPWKLLFLFLYLLNIKGLIAEENNYDNARNNPEMPNYYPTNPKQTIEEIYEALEWVNVPIFSYGKRCYNNQLNIDKERYAHCVKDICGADFETYSDYINKLIDKGTYSFDKIPNDFKDKFKNHFRKKRINKTKILKYLSELKDKTNLKYNEKLKHLHSVGFFLALDDLFKRSVHEDGAIHIVGIDKEKLASLPYQFDKKILDTAVKAVNEIGLFQVIGRISKDPKSYLKEKYPELSLGDGVIALARDAKRKTKEYKRKHHYVLSVFPDILSSLDEGKLDKIIAGMELTEEGLDGLLVSVEAVDQIFKIVETPDKFPTLASFKVDINKLIKELKVAESASWYLEALRDKTKELDLIENDTVEGCYSSFIISDLLPSRREKEEFRLKLSKYKKEFKHKIGRFYSEETMASLNKIIDKLEFSLPEEKAKADKNFKNDLDNFFSKASREMDTYDSLSGENKREANLFEIYSFLEKQDVDLFTDLRELCSSKGISPDLNDAANTISEKVLVSWQSLKIPKLGKEVIFHELGHHIYHFFKVGTKKISPESFKKFKANTKCLNSSHPELYYGNYGSTQITETPTVVDKKRIFEESKYTAEDFSDFISSLAGDNNFGCHLMKNKIQDGIAWDVLMNFDKKDTHSNDFFRLLHFELVNKGELPESCHGFSKGTDGDGAPIIQDCSKKENLK